PVKIARLAVATATLLHSTDETHTKVIVTPAHVVYVGRLLAGIYTHQNCAFDQYAKVLRDRVTLTEEEHVRIEAALLTPGSNREDIGASVAMLDLFLTDDDIPKPDLEAASGLKKDALNDRIGLLRKHRLITAGRGGYRKTARF